MVIGVLIFIFVSIHSRLIKPGESGMLTQADCLKACFNPLPTNKAGRIGKVVGVFRTY